MLALPQVVPSAPRFASKSSGANPSRDPPLSSTGLRDTPADPGGGSRTEPRGGAAPPARAIAPGSPAELQEPSLEDPPPPLAAPRRGAQVPRSRTGGHSTSPESQATAGQDASGSGWKEGGDPRGTIPGAVHEAGPDTPQTRRRHPGSARPSALRPPARPARTAGPRRSQSARS